MDSILTSIKKLLGPSASYTHFDPDIIMHINSVFADLWKLGVGPANGFRIEDDTSLWTDYIPNDDMTLESVKSYMYLRVKLLFDPPLNSAVLEAMKAQADKWEWLLCDASDNH